jgi:hypothetical protein
MVQCKSFSAFAGYLPVTGALIGVRVALGAGSRQILVMVVNEGMKTVLLGVMVGLLGAWALTRTMTHLLASVPVIRLFMPEFPLYCFLWHFWLVTFRRGRGKGRSYGDSEIRVSSGGSGNVASSCITTG